ncbi:carbonic anhydrase 14 isoform X2 [Psammomys obesus]|uniref:carbonic anhydrase 14 isoform X2 n=1 Tax=Psammomys obesus TaxID=48139 RepID=UPI002452F422|nr:carbonic anhydrase 14 isoform X2 [Psammomys obesus]
MGVTTGHMKAHMARSIGQPLTPSVEAMPSPPSISRQTVWYLILTCLLYSPTDMSSLVLSLWIYETMAIQLSLPPSLHLGGLPRKYTAAQLHLHWGQKGSREGSEHQIDGEATAAELHVVHYDSESYGSLAEAAQEPQGLAVLGILIEVGESENPAYDHILSHLHEIRYKDQTTSVAPFNVRELLPGQLEQFFRYNGSLTTPPCYQSVLWTVFSRRAQISVGQLEKLQGTLLSTEEEPSEALAQNYRVPQPLNQRTIFVSFIQVGSLSTTGEMLGLGVGILAGCLCLLLAAYFIARKIRKKRLGNRKSVVFTSARATTEA